MSTRRSNSRNMMRSSTPCRPPRLLRGSATSSQFLKPARPSSPQNFDRAFKARKSATVSLSPPPQQAAARRDKYWWARGYTETLADFAALNARSKFWGDDGRAGFKNWEEVTDPRNPLGGRQGVDERIM